MPFESDSDDNIAIFNQACVLIMLYLQFLCTNYVNNDTFKEKIVGNLMMVVFILSIFGNVVVGVFEIIKPTLLKIKRWLYQRRIKRAIKANIKGRVDKTRVLMAGTKNLNRVQGASDAHTKVKG